MADKFILISENINHSDPMEQTEMRDLLVEEGVPKSDLGSLNQALNDVAFQRGKPSGGLTFDGYPVLHASAGKVGRSSVSIFWYEKDDNHFIVAVGEHRNSTTYRLTYHGQTEGEFREGNTITLDN